MSEESDVSANPFLPAPPTEPATIPDAAELATGLRRRDPFGGGFLLSPSEQAALQTAPKRGSGTQVTVYGTPIGMTGNTFDHMYVEYDDGRRQLIARGGPSLQGADFWGGTLDGSDRVRARVTPADQSKDFGKPSRVLAQRFLSGETAEQAALPARLHAHGVNRGGNFYGIWDSNSNSFAGDVTAPIFGRRIGDRRTPGYMTPLRNGGSPPPPWDFSPAMAAGPY